MAVGLLDKSKRVPQTTMGSRRRRKRRSRGFVVRDGSNFVKGGRVFKPIGYAHNNLLGDNRTFQCAPYVVSYADRSNRVRQMKAAGADIIRFWAFQSYFTNNRTREREWGALDELVGLARKYDVMLMPVLEAPWVYCQPPMRGYLYADWYERGYTTATYGVYPVSFRQFAREVVARYKHEPYIFSWTLASEAEAKNRSNNSSNPQALYNFTVDMVITVKAIDTNHLLTLGVIGSGQPGIEGDHYEHLHAIDGIDYCEIHDYGRHEEGLPGAPYAPIVQTMASIFVNGLGGWRSGDFRDGRSRLWQSNSYTAPPGGITHAGLQLDPKPPETRVQGPVYIDNVTLDGQTFDFEDGTLQGFECSPQFYISNQRRPDGTGRALRVDVLSAGVGQVFRRQPARTVSYDWYCDNEGLVKHANTPASAYAVADKLNKPMVVGEFGMPVTYDGSGYPVETIASRHAKMRAKMDVQLAAGADCMVLWHWWPYEGRPAQEMQILTNGSWTDPLVAEVRAR
jgi:hypothetical protein